MDTKEKIKKFIKDNKLSFKGTGSALNGNCTIICGYCLHLEGSLEDIETAIQEDNSSLEPYNYQDELDRVYAFAYKYNYGQWWKEDVAKKMYKF